MSNATQGHLGNTELYSATNRQFSITEPIKGKTLKVKLLSAESHPYPISQVSITLHLLSFLFLLGCFFLVVVICSFEWRTLQAKDWEQKGKD